MRSSGTPPNRSTSHPCPKVPHALHSSANLLRKCLFKGTPPECPHREPSYSVDRHVRVEQRAKLRRSETARLSDFLGNLGKRKVFQVAGITIELADTFCQLLGGHRVLVVHPTKCLLVQVEALFFVRLRFCRIEFTPDDNLGLVQLLEKLWTDGQQI